MPTRALKRLTPPERSKPIALDYPRFIPFCLAKETFRVPTGPRWVHELKYDGYRTQLHLRPDRPVLYSRRGFDWASRYDSIAQALNALKARHAVMDAEIVSLYPDGRPDYWTLQVEAAK